MHQITTDSLNKVLAVHEPPCISLYLPTHRSHPENQQDPIRYRNLIRDMESSLARQYPARNVKSILEKFQSLERDTIFWNHRTEGLAILGSSDIFEIFELQVAVAELLVVADSFHSKPLLRALQTADRFQVLALNRHEVKLFQGNRDSLDEVNLAPEVPRTLKDALGDELTEPHKSVASAGAAGTGGAMHYGQGQKKDEVELDNERFFRVVDRAILEHHSRPSGLPLILVALPEHHAIFRKVSHNPFLIRDSIGIDPWSLPINRLRDEAYRLLVPHFRKQVEKLNSDFQEAKARYQGASDLSDIGQALVANRVGTLLIEADRQIAGKLDPVTGLIEFGELADPRMDDLLDDMAESTLRAGGQVVVLPADQMPTNTGAAAIFRY